ncbi:MAG TPA: hypothetical protein VGF06_12035 [Terriglobales bacterium]|jgi:hypothetical protein
MKRPLVLIAILIATVSISLAGPKGTAPRPEASRYPAHAEHDGIAVGARLLSREEARKAFVSDVNRCCLVAEVAIYPQKDHPLEISLDQLALRVTGSETASKPFSAKTAAATLQKQAKAQRDISIYPTTEIGYESGSGYDPATGTQRTKGVYTRSGVGVGIGGQAPASTDKDRSAMEIELGEKGLQEGSASAPVAGYVYFPVASKKKAASYQLEYMVNGERVVLALPQP